MYLNIKLLFWFCYTRMVRAWSHSWSRKAGLVQTGNDKNRETYFRKGIFIICYFILDMLFDKDIYITGNIIQEAFAYCCCCCEL